MLPTHQKALNVHVVSPEEVEASFINPDLGMLILTWVVFFLLLGILYRFAWRPILAALDAREKSIRKSVDDVERIKREMENIEQTRKQLIGEAHAKSKEIIDHSRKAARDAAQIIEQKARETAKISLENALRDIREETQKAQLQLRREGAHIAIELASKLIEENLDTEKNQKTVNRLMQEI
jgi:F-type H+-transporting ATPase subunit b